MSLTNDPAFQHLLRLFEGGAKDLKITQLFQDDPDRFQKFRYIWMVFFNNF